MSSCCNKSKSTSVTLDNLDDNICYCFKVSKQTLFDAIQSGTEVDIINEIKVKMNDPGCFCETANPTGKCCLGDIEAFIKLVKK